MLVWCCLLVAGLRASSAATWTETFESDPQAGAWEVFGEAELFHWNGADNSLRVTWDSSKQNSYYYRRLGYVLSRRDDFRFSFDLQLDAVAGGVNPQKPCGFEIAVGLVNLESATKAGFRRGSGFQAPNLVEFDYFPAGCYDATIASTIVSTNNQFRYAHNFPADIPIGGKVRVTMDYSSTNEVLTTTIEQEGVPARRLKDVPLGGTFSDFRLDAFAVSSYSDEGSPMDSVLGNGRISRVEVTIPEPPVTNLSGSWNAIGNWVCSFTGRSGWEYFLEHSEDLARWSAVGGPVTGVEGRQSLKDEGPGGKVGFYRVRGERP